jgi:hypothetical protein
MRRKVSRGPVASACEHARDSRLHTDDAPSRMSNHEVTGPLPHQDQQLCVQMLACE